MSSYIIKLLLFVFTFGIYEYFFEKNHINYLDEHKAKNKANIIVTSIFLTIISTVLIYITHEVHSIENYSSIYLVFYIILFKSLYNLALFIILPIVKRKCIRKFPNNKKFQYYETVFKPNLYACLFCGLVSAFLQYTSESFKNIYLEIGKMMYFVTYLSYNLSAIRCSLEDKKIDIKRIKGIDKGVLYFKELIYLLKQRAFLLISIAMIAIYIWGFVNR